MQDTNQQKSHTSSHDELGDKVDVVVAGCAKLGIGLLSGLELLDQLVEIQRSTFATIEVVAVHVQDLEGIRLQERYADTKKLAL
jgi:hypothetical protein